jgi:acyl-CoA thioester hydrolase
VDGFRFSTELSVRFAETDAQGVANNAAYAVWLEVARVAYLARHAGGYKAIREQGIEAIVTESHLRFLSPARFDDHLRIHARCGDVRGARFRYEYVVERVADGEVLADGWTSHACVDRDTLRPKRLPAWLVAAIASAERGDPAQGRPD